MIDPSDPPIVRWRPVGPVAPRRVRWPALIAFSVCAMLLALLALFLASCSTSALEYRCPALQQYTEAQQLAALAELQTYQGKLPQTHEMLSDYNRLRNACRAMQRLAS